MMPSFESFGLALAEDSWSNLEEAKPRLASELERLIGGGATPGAVKRFVMEQGHSPDLAQWLECAARWLEHEAADDRRHPPLRSAAASQ